MRLKILILGLIYLLILNFILLEGKERGIDSWEELFPDHLERVYIIMKDGGIIKHTSHYSNKIYSSMESLKNTLKKAKNKNYRIKDILVIIHNHFRDFRFSLDDHRQYRRLKKYGFTGCFLLYSHLTKEVYDIED